MFTTQQFHGEHFHANVQHDPCSTHQSFTFNTHQKNFTFLACLAFLAFLSFSFLSLFLSLFLTAVDPGVVGVGPGIIPAVEPGVVGVGAGPGIIPAVQPGVVGGGVRVNTRRGNWSTG